MNLYTYDPKNVNILVGGISISGFVDGTFLECDMDEDAFIKRKGADGITSRAKNNNNSGTITITLQQTSPSNAVLQGFALLDRASGKGIIPVLINEAGTASTIATGFAWVKKVAKPSYAKEVLDRQWVLDCAELDIVVGGNVPEA